MIDLCQWRARIGSYNCSCHWIQPSSYTNSTSNIYCNNGARNRSTATTQMEAQPKFILSIFCLLILLFISGDVELNPGPTLTDKPTRDELVELFSSSEFTAGTWEQFVCYLPNMTPEVIAGIKQEDVEDPKEEETSSIDYMSAVAQSCLDNISNVTWKVITLALIDAKELVMIRRVIINLTECSCLQGLDESTKNYLTVQKVLRRHYVQLKEVTESWLQNFADKMYSSEMISRDVHKSPTFEKIAHEFTCSLIYENITELEKKCQLFLTILSSNGGPGRMEARALAKDWEQELLKKHNIKWVLSHNENDEMVLNPEIEVNTKDEIAIKLDTLKKKFSLLAVSIREYYHNSDQHKVIDVARYFSECLDDDNVVRYTELATIDSIFDAAREHYDFLNCELIIDLVDELPLNDDLQSKFQEYVKELEYFNKSTTLQQIERKIRKAVQPKEELCQLIRDVVIKVTGVYNRKTIAHLKILLKYIFGNETKLLNLIDIRKGSITLIFLAPSSKVQTFIVKIKAIEKQYFHYLGVFQIVINDKTIIDEAEISNFTLEKSLVDIILNIHRSNAKDAKFERLAFLLIQFDININYKNEKGFCVLHLASEIGHYRIVKALLEKGADINIQDDNGWTPLIAASTKGEYQVVELLLSKNADINVQNKNGWTALMFACTKYQNTAEILLSKNPEISIQDECFGLTALMIASTAGLPVVETILNRAKPSDINICDNKGMTPLMLACQQGHYQTVKLILSKNPDLNIRNNVAGLTALMLASILGRHQIVKLLLSKDPDINIKSFEGMTALMLAANERQFQVIASLLEKNPDMNVQGNNGMTALINASSKGYHEIVELLLSKNPDINIQNNEGWDALMFASSQGHHQVVELLLSKNPNIIYAQANNGYTALMLASGIGHHQVVEVLLSKGDNIINIQDNNGWTALMFANSNGHHQIVKILLGKDPDINIQNNVGHTVLIAASANGNHQVVELLLHKNPDINMQANDGLTALMFASCNGHHQVVELLLSKDPDINIQNDDGQTALMGATLIGNYQVVELLLGNNPDINIQDNSGLTALMAASSSGHHHVVELLLSKDPDINIQNKNGVTALMFASSTGFDQVVRVLLSKNPNINIQDNTGWTALMFGVADGHYQVVKLLLSKNPDINIQNNEGMTALIFACSNGHHQVVELLLSKDSNIDIQHKDGWTALIFASSNGYLDIVETLLNKDPDINIQTNNGETALIAASCNGHRDIVEVLLFRDVDINIQNNDGWTALMFCIANEHYHVVEVLLRKDPDMNIRNNHGITTLMLACSKGHHQVVELLLTKDQDINIKTNHGSSALMTASCDGHHQVVELLLNKDPNINIQDNDGWTALIAASANGHHQVVELLLSKNPDIDIQNKNGMTALMFASSNGHHQVVELLLNRDPDVNIQNIYGGASLMLASIFDHHHVVELLLHKNPDINTQDDNGWTALIAASTYGHHRIVELLLSKDPDIDIQNKDGITALMAACSYGHHQVVELLLSKGTNIDIQNNIGLNAFTFCLFCSMFFTSDDAQHQLQSGNYAKTFELLINSPQFNHIHSIDNVKLHSLAVAAIYNSFDAVAILMKNCDLTPENIISAFTRACYEGHSSMMLHLSEKITTLSVHERKLLVAAAEGDLGTLISMIYEAGMSLDTPLVAGITPLMIAASSGHAELVEALIEAGADVNKMDDEGLNALEIVNDIEKMLYDRTVIKELLITNTQASEPDPVPNKKPNLYRNKSLYDKFKSFIKKACDPYGAKQKEMKITNEVPDPYNRSKQKIAYKVPSALYSAFTSNKMAQIVF